MEKNPNYELGSKESGWKFETPGTSFDLNTGKLEMKNVEVNTEFPRIWEGKGEK